MRAGALNDRGVKFVFRYLLKWKLVADDDPNVYSYAAALRPANTISPRLHILICILCSPEVILKRFPRAPFFGPCTQLFARTLHSTNVPPSPPPGWGYTLLIFAFYVYTHTPVIYVRLLHCLHYTRTTQGLRNMSHMIHN